jgi:hypothetical protein
VHPERQVLTRQEPLALEKLAQAQPLEQRPQHLLYEFDHQLLFL